MATSNVESSVATAGERKSQQQNAPNEYFYLFHKLTIHTDRIKRISRLIYGPIYEQQLFFFFLAFFLCLDYL